MLGKNTIKNTGLMKKIDIIVVAVAFAIIIGLMMFPDDANAATKKWNDPVQCSYYTMIGSHTANGSLVTTKTMGVAVPYNKVVSKSKWKKGSKKYKRTHFYYGEKLELKHGKRTVKVKVVDCGGFGYYGQYKKGKWYPRLFDLQVAVKHKLKCNDVDIIKWRIIS